MIDTLVQDLDKENKVSSEQYNSGRCDACGARAVTSVVIKDDLPPLEFCGHHLRKHSAALDKISAVYFVDEWIEQNVFFREKVNA